MPIGPSADLRALVDFCANCPGAVMSHRWGETVFTVDRRVFAFIGTPADVTVKATPAGRKRALSHPCVRRARYVGIFGWLTVTVVDRESLRVAYDLIDHSYRLIIIRR